jgi:DNA-binding response OmpR family regulator
MNEQPQATLLVVEDDDAMATFLADNLTADGYNLLVAGSVREALHALANKVPDLALIDAALPDASGLDLLAAVRAADGLASRINPRTPLILLGERSSELDRVRAFDKGADDFVAMPFSYPELRGRVGALLRRSEDRHRSGRLRVGELELDPSSRTVTVSGRPVALSQKEFALLRTLASEPTRVFTKAELMRTVWGFRSVGTTRTLDSHACRLRSKLGAHGVVFVINVWGVGYRLIDAPAPAELLAAA